MSTQLSELLPNHLAVFSLGVIIVAPILSIILFLLLACGWFLQLPLYTCKKGPVFKRELSGVKEPSNKKEGLKKNHSKESLLSADYSSRPRIKRGWIRVATTPNPIQTPTMFEVMHDMVIKNWNSSTSFLSNTSAFALNLGSSITNLANINGTTPQPPNTPQIPSASRQSSKSIYSNNEVTSYSSTPDDSSVLGALVNSLSADPLGLKQGESSKEPRTNSEQEYSDDIIKPNDHRKCKPSQRNAHGWHYAVLGDSALSFFKDNTCQELVTVLKLPMYDVGLYPFDLDEGELYHITNPILLAGHSVPVPDPIHPSTSSSHEVHYSSSSEPQVITTGFVPTNQLSSSQSRPTTPSIKMWLPNYYLFAESPVEKESWHEALLSHCRFPFSNSQKLKTFQENSQSPEDVKEEPSNNEDKTEPFTGLSRHSLKLTPSAFDPFSFQDLRTRLFGMDTISNSSHSKSDSDPESMAWFNALCGRVYLGLKDSDFLHRTLRILFKDWADQHVPSWLIFEFEKFSLGPRLPYISKIPSVKHIDNQGELTVKIPIQHFGSLFSFRFYCNLFPDSFNPALWLSSVCPGFLHSILTRLLPDTMPNFFRRRFLISSQVSLKIKDGCPFQTQLITTLHGLPTRNCWVGMTSLPKPSQLEITLILGSRSISIPKWMIKQGLVHFKKFAVYPSLLPIPFFPQNLMLASEPTWDSDQPLPLLIQTLTQSLTQSRNLRTGRRTNKEGASRRTSGVYEVADVSKKRFPAILPMLRPLVPKLSALDLRFYTNLRGASRLMTSQDDDPQNQPPAPTITSGAIASRYTGGLALSLRGNRAGSPVLESSRDIIPLFDSVFLRMASSAPPQVNSNHALVHLKTTPEASLPPEAELPEDNVDKPSLQSSRMLQAFEPKLTHQSTPDLSPTHSSRGSICSQRSLLIPEGSVSKLARSPTGPTRCTSGWALHRLSSLSCSAIVTASATSTSASSSPALSPRRSPSSLNPLQFTTSNLHDYFVI